MSQVLEVRKTSEGKVFARRNDGLPLTLEDREEARKLADAIAPPCYNCDAPMTEAKDIDGRECWVCWRCAKTV